MNVMHENLRGLALLCRASLDRLGVQKVGLYQQHWPGKQYSLDKFLLQTLCC